MRPVFAYFAALTLIAAGSSQAAVTPTTVLLQFEQPHAEKTLQEVRSELSSIMKDAGLTFELRLFSELSPWTEFGDLMVVRLKGRCRLDASSVPPQDKGPLAFTHTSDGKVLPFVEVACDRIRAAVRPVLWGEQLRHTDELMGRALARVIAHEIYHIVAGTRAHGGSGVARHALSGAQLVAEHLSFTAEDVERMIVAGASGSI